MIGSDLGPYRILEKIGEGGMGAVYRGMDTRLNRPVAIKILSGSGDSGPRQRFLQEARAASALNHPHIVHVYDIGSTDDTDYIVMEFVDGETLHDTIAGKGLPLKTALEHAIQIADALAAAHAAGIVHRDVKPSNIRITSKGVVKVLDFGLAKLVQVGSAGESESTRTLQPETAEGTILGTFAYMSPEQAQGQPADHRADIFSFGALLYEMLAGQRVFQRESTVATLSAILRDDPPPLHTVVKSAPYDLERIVTRCLRKDPEYRFQHMDDVKVALREVRDQVASGAAAAVPEIRRRHTLRWVAATVLPIIVLSLVAWRLLLRRPVLHAVELTRVTSDAGLTEHPALSRDGRLLAYVSDRDGGVLHIWVQQVGLGDPVRVTSGPADDTEPSFSPDGTLIAFHSQRDGGGIYVVPALGGMVRRIVDQGRGPRFSPDGQWIAYWTGDFGVFSRNSTYIVPSSGGQPRRIAPDFYSAYHPLWSKDGRHVLFMGARDDKKAVAERYDWWVAPVDGAPPVATGALGALGKLRVFPVMREPPGDWVDDMVVFAATTSPYATLLVTGVNNQSSIWSVRIAPPSWRMMGTPQQLTAGAGIEVQPSIAQPAEGMARLALATTSNNAELWALPVDANAGKVTGEMQRLTTTVAANGYPFVSRDGSKIVFNSDGRRNFDICLKDMRSGAETVLTATEVNEFSPILSPDSTTVLYYAFAPGRRPSFTFHTVSAQGGSPRQVCGDCDGPLYDWSANGRKAIYFKAQSGGPGHLMAHDLETGQEHVFLEHPKYQVRAPHLSRDERWVAFNTVISQTQRRIYVAPVSDWRGAPESEWIPITDGKTGDRAAIWSPDGNLLYLLSERDGFRCFWAQRLDPATRHPLGASFEVQAFHRARRSLNYGDEVAGIGPSVGPDKLIFSMPEHTGSIWIAKLEPR